MNEPEAVNVTARFNLIILFGFFVHLAGIIGDSAVAASIKVKRPAWFKQAAYLACGIYTLGWLAWLVSILVIRFNHAGRVCSGSYLDEG